MVQLASLYRNSLKSYEASKIAGSESENRKKEFPPIPASFHHSVYFAARLFVGTLFVLLSDFMSVCLSDCLSLCLPVCLSYVFLQRTAKTSRDYHLLTMPFLLFSDASLHPTALIHLLAHALRCAHSFALLLNHSFPSWWKNE